MYNYTNTMLAILVKLHLLTSEGAQEWSTKLGSEIHRADFQDALQTIEKVTGGDVNKFLVEPWLADVSRLEKRVADLEKKVLDKAK